MEFAINAGVKVDLATPAEVREIVSSELKGWQAELVRGTRYRHPGSQAAANAAGAVNLPAAGDQLGPLEGFVWSISAATVLGLTAAQIITAYINDSTPLMAKGVFSANVSTIVWGDRGLVLNSGDRLVLVGAGLTVGATYSVALEVTELPVQLASRLL